MQLFHVGLYSALHPVDTSVLILCSVVFLLMGVYYRALPRDGADFLLAGRAAGWGILGCSFTMVVISGPVFWALPAAAYDATFKSLWMPVTVWLAIAVVTGLILPILQRLKLETIYDYLELRFNATVRVWSGRLFVFWRLLVLVVAFHLSCSWFAEGGAWDDPAWWLVLWIGGLGTVYTGLGGLRAVLGTDVVKVGLIFLGLMLMIGAAWLQLDGGSDRVWMVAKELQRTEWGESGWRSDSAASIWGYLPHAAVTYLLWYLADQTVAQRYLAASSVAIFRRSFLLQAALVAVLLPMLAYLGLCLLAYYQDHPRSVRPKWVVNVDPQTGRSRLDPATGRPWLEWHEADQMLRAENLSKLVAERRLIEPNRGEPYPDVAEFWGGESDAERAPELAAGLPLERLAARKPPRGLARQGELILHERARIELLPWFITHHLPWGVRGLVLAAVVSALLAVLDAGLNSLATMGLLHGQRDLGWWRGGLAYLCRKPLETWNEQDELFAARGLVFVLGILLTLAAACCSALKLDGKWLIGNLSCLGAPLLAVFMLGLFSRRTTSRGALVALGGGVVLALVLLLLSLGSDPRGLDLDGLSDLDPRRPTSRFLPISALPLTLVGSLLLGLLASRMGDRPKSKNELRGLVVGLRPLSDLKKISLGK